MNKDRQTSETIRKTIIALLSIGIIAGAYMVYKNVSQKNSRTRKAKPQKVTQVYTNTVENASIPINIKASGTLSSKKRIELYAEVAGIFQESAHPFKSGTYFAKDETLIKIESIQQQLNLKSQRSSFYNQLVQMLPDLKFDYPQSVNQWEDYINKYEIDRPIKPIPTPIDTREKLFIANQNISTTYYNIKNLEEQLKKFIIRAPFNGMLIESMIEPGTAVRVGQQLGTFISPYTYEVEVSVNTSYDDFLKIGKRVKLYNKDRSKSWTGKVSRINSTVDPGSQTIPVYVDVKGEGLREGMYLEADLTGRNEQNVYEIDRKLLVGDNEIFIVRDTLLDLVQIEPIYYKDETVLVKGLDDGVKILANSTPGAHKGMIVKNISE